MKLQLANLPDDADQLASWLDQQLVSERLPQLAGELAACHGDRTSEALGDEEIARLALNGLDGAPQETVSRLLQDPSGLMALQREVLVNEGRHWQGVAADEETTRRIAAGRETLAAWLADAGRASPPLGDHIGPQSNLAQPPSRRVLPGRVGRLAGLMSLAAGLLLCFYAGRQSVVPPAAAPQAVAWGWNAPGMTDPAVDRTAYLNRLADGADAWFKKRPTEPQALANRIGAFRRGCTRLLLSDHPPLTDADRAWLRDRCLKWAAAIDGQLLALEGGANPAAVRDALDGVITKLATALRKQAAA